MVEHCHVTKSRHMVEHCHVTKSRPMVEHCHVTQSNVNDSPTQETEDPCLALGMVTQRGGTPV